MPAIITKKLVLMEDTYSQIDAFVSFTYKGNELRDFAVDAVADDLR